MGDLPRGRYDFLTDSPTFGTVTLTDLTALRLVYTDANKALASVTDLNIFLTGTNNISVDDAGSGKAEVNGTLLVPYTGATGNVTLGTHDLIFTGTGPGAPGSLSFANTAYGTTAQFDIGQSGYFFLSTSADLVFAPGATNSTFFGDPTHVWKSIFGTSLHSNSLTTLSGDLSITAAGGDISFGDDNTETTGRVCFGVGTVSLPSLCIGIEPATGFYRIAANNWGWAAGGIKGFDFSGLGLGTVDGSAAAPSYTFNTNFTEGMFRIATDRLGFAAAGVQRLECNTTGVLVAGTLGIGTTNPGTTLEVQSSSPILRLRDTGATASATTAFVEFGGTDAAAWSRTGFVGDASSGNTDIYLCAEISDLHLGDSSGFSVMNLQGGNVGIGLTAVDANYKLIIRRAADINLGVGLQSSELAIAAFNDVLSANIPMRFYASEFNLLNGNVGINETAPQYKLEVNGTLGVTGIATLGDSSQMATSAAPTADVDIANKKYVDDQITAAPAGSRTASIWETFSFTSQSTTPSSLPGTTVYTSYGIARNIANTQNSGLTIRIPGYFNTLTKAIVVLIPQASDGSHSVTISTEISAAGESLDGTHSDSDVTAYNWTGQQNLMQEIDISSGGLGLLTNLDADDYLGVKVTNNDSNTVKAVGVYLEFTT